MQSSLKETETLTKNEEIESDIKTETKGTTALVLKTVSEFDQICQNEYKQFLFMTSIKAPYFRPEIRASVDLICVVDESGSMSGQPIELVKTTVEFIIKNLESNDRFGCVGYSSKTRRVLNLTKMDSEGKQKAMEAVKSIAATSNTALCDGLVLGLKMMRERRTTNVVSSVMLFTDGAANVGYTSARDIIRATMDEKFANKGNLVDEADGVSYRSAGVNTTKQLTPAKEQIQPGTLVGQNGTASPDPQQRKQDTTNEAEGAKTDLPCTINSFGFGEGHNESLLQAIAEHGHGMYVFIKTAEMIGKTLAEFLGGLVSVVAQDIVLRVETLSGVKINQCLSTGLNVRALRPNHCYEVTLSDIQSEENRDIVFQLSVPIVNESKLDWPLAQVVCTYTNIILGGKNEQVSTIASIARVESKETGERNHDLDLQHNRIIAAAAMIDADTLADSGKLAEARMRLTAAQLQIHHSPSSSNIYSVGLVKDIQQCSGNLRDDREYRREGGKNLRMNYHSHSNQRSVQSSEWNSQTPYLTSFRSAMIKNFNTK